MESRPQSAAEAALQPARTGRLDALDGLRGIAILVVMTYHFFNSPVGGFLGVDLFFVLSGFLITNRLLRDSADFGARQLRDFYYGRVLRIAPALAEMILLFGAMHLAYPLKATLFRENVLSSVFLVSNWALASQRPYPDYILHTWSLSIEEQYYLIWPLIIFVTLRAARGERALAWVAGLATAALWGVRFLLALNPAIRPYRLYFGTDTRIPSILMGCLIAVLLRDRQFRAALQRRPRRAAVIAGIALAAVIGCVARFDWCDRPMYYWGLSLFSSACAVIVVYFVTFGQSAAGRALTWRPLIWMGKRSYGLYLFHYPIFRWVLGVLNVKTGWKMLLFCGPPTLVLATLSWRYIEEPFMRLRYRRNIGSGTPDPIRTASAASPQF